MKAILEIPEKEISFELDNVRISQFRVIGRRPDDKIPMMIERYPIGEPIALITSNMPDPLRVEIIKLIEHFCGH